jgi:hypothetical protein
MKRKTLQEVMKMTEKERFMYYAELVYGHKNFSVNTTPASYTVTVTVWDYLSSNEFDYTCIDVCYIRHADGIVLLEKYLDKWL